MSNPLLKDVKRREEGKPLPEQTLSLESDYDPRLAKKLQQTASKASAVAKQLSKLESSVKGTFGVMAKEAAAMKELNKLQRSLVKARSEAEDLAEVFEDYAYVVGDDR